MDKESSQEIWTVVKSVDFPFERSLSLSASSHSLYKVEVFSEGQTELTEIFKNYSEAARRYDNLVDIIK